MCRPVEINIFVSATTSADLFSIGFRNYFLGKKNVNSLYILQVYGMKKCLEFRKRDFPFDFMTQVFHIYILKS